MGLFKSFKKMLAPIGGAVGFALGGPMGAALGSGIGSLAGGGDIEDALLAGALGGAAGFAGQKFFGLTQAPAGATGIAKLLPGRQMVTGYDSALGKAIVESKPMMGIGSKGFGGKALPADKGIFSLFDDMGMGTKLGLGAGALALTSGLFGEEEEKDGPRRPEGPPGRAFGKVVGRSRKEYDVDDPTDMKQYADELKELQKPGYNYYNDPYRPVRRSSGYADGGDVHAGGGEVSGPGTGTSDSVPARLSDGEFVLTAKAVRGAGGGNRDTGAARLYDMMSELEATG